MQDSPMCGTKMQITSKPTSSPRSRRKPKWKLKFHHQALPQEYLNHYETWQHAQPPSPAPLTSITQTLCPPLVPEIDLPSPSPSSTRSSPLSSPPVLKTPRPLPSPPSSVRLTDLPYMGEMILDNARPRRGRKPKKLDICHLIYKNYGTTVVDEPLNLCMRDFAIPTTNRLQPTTSLINNTMGTTILHHNSHSPDNQVSMCKFKFTSGAKPSLMEKKLLTSTHHMIRNHQSQSTPSPQPRRKPLDFLTQQQLLGKLLVNEQAKLVSTNPTGTNANSSRRPSSSNSDLSSRKRNSNFSRTIPSPSGLSSRHSINFNMSELSSPFNIGEDFKDLTNPRIKTEGEDFKTEFSDLSLMDFSSRDPMMGLEQSPSSDMLTGSGDVDMDSDADGECGSNDVPEYNAAFSLPPLSPVESLSEFQRSLSESLLNQGERQVADRDSPRSHHSPAPPHNRRKSRKSQAREKLEKTFKEKGFLIQTQQLESAEGATYCKFRQLRKFTRYLFRSWKTHLPGEVVNETYNTP